jgi:hypothetical protein
MQSGSDHALLREIVRSLMEPEFELRFSLKWLFFGMTAIAIGIAMIVWAYDAENILFLIACWFGGGATIGAGLLGLFRRPMLGAFVGFMVQAAVFFLIFLVALFGGIRIY